jgi:hypothetical protein
MQLFQNIYLDEGEVDPEALWALKGAFRKERRQVHGKESMSRSMFYHHAWSHNRLLRVGQTARTCEG